MYHHKPKILKLKFHEKSKSVNITRMEYHSLVKEKTRSLKDIKGYLFGKVIFFSQGSLYVTIYIILSTNFILKDSACLYPCFCVVLVNLLNSIPRIWSWFPPIMCWLYDGSWVYPWQCSLVLIIRLVHVHHCHY